MSELKLDPKKVLASPWLWDEKTLAWARQQIESATTMGPDHSTPTMEGTR